MEQQYVGFEIEKNKYCINIMFVKEVVKENKITELPDSPSFVLGIMNLRGIVVPVLSLKKKLGLEKKEQVKGANTESKLIIINIDNVLIGLAVDNLDRVFSVDSSQIQMPEKLGETQISKELIEGVTKFDENIYLILDIKKILDIEEKIFIQNKIIE